MIDALMNQRGVYSFSQGVQESGRGYCEKKPRLLKGRLCPLCYDNA